MNQHHLRWSKTRRRRSPIEPNNYKKSSTSVIADQKIEPSCPSTELMTENSVSGVEVKADHEGESSSAPVPNPEKWSHEAIVARANVRPERMQKLKVAANSGQNPGFDFLLSCWSDDPAKADSDQETAGEVSTVGNCSC
ncbi:hypothetical protein IQ276_037850 [Desmonostoc muscorum LEGE 12446]|uniref:Uncharacterized protein n=1 Tax=Desmonostoc muscorum LEGE 12446 TaxID=1828758 RepID=A0A8J7AB89_DESMC|nr:hypothetical protein [Desmonostoc muscorum]MCF2152066.1 hypothetical protein [Desmonostoc muscorum LEGE 12446]